MRKLFVTLFFGLIASTAFAKPSPNIVFVFIDDIGWGDLSSYGSSVLDKAGNPITPNLDRLAAEGTRFTNGYVAAPICSPSRVGVFTGMHPARHGIHSFLNNRGANANRNMNDWLQPDAVTSARIFRDAGYATGQFGKWHMGGGRDVNDAPFPQDYGFETSLVSFEGMGDRILYIGDGLSEANADVPGAITWTEWYNGAKLHTDAAIDFMTASHLAGKSFYIHVPYNDTHSPYHVAPGHENDFDHITNHANAQRFLGELHALDKQIGRLVAALDDLGIAEETLVVVVGDNGAPNDNLNTLLNRNGGLRGGKGGLWEGGIRVPFIIRMPGTVAAGVVNSTTAVSTLDLLPTYCALAGIPLPSAPFEGEDMSDVFRGSARPRTQPLFWEYGTVSGIDTPAPNLAVRVGDLKFLMNPKGANRHLYDLTLDGGETTNLIAAPEHADAVASMEAMLLRWYKKIILGDTGEKYVAEPAGDPAILIADDFDLPDGDSATFGFGGESGVNENLSTRQTGTLAGGLRYIHTNPAKPASAHSIVNGALQVAKAPNPTAFQFSADNGVSPYDFGDLLRGRRYEWRVTLEHADPDPAAQRMTLGIADSPNPPGGVGGHVLGIQLNLTSDNTISVFKRIVASAHAASGNINTAIATGLPPGDPVDLRVVMSDSTNDSGFHTSYEVYVNGTRADTGNIRFSSDSRYFIFDTAPNTGPVRYDNFALETLDTGGEVLRSLPVLALSDLGNFPVSGVETVRLHWSTEPGQVVRPVISSDLETWRPLLAGGSPLHVETVQGTIRWLEVEIPEAFRDRAFLRLEVVK